MNEQESGSGAKFDPTRHLRQLRGRGGTTDYLDVKWRLVWLRSEHPDAQISTEHVTIDADQAIFKATVTIPGGGSASGYGSETARDFNDFIEKAETKSLGRALIALGYGTQFAQELGEDESLEPTGGANAAPVRPAAPQFESTSSPPRTPRADPIPADTRRPAPVRPLREAEPDELPAPAAPVAEIGQAPDDDGADQGAISGTATRVPEPVVEAVAPAVDNAARARPTRLSPPQPAPRPAPRPAPAPETAADAEAEAGAEIDMANFGWTEFWSWARTRGYSDRKALDAAVGRPTNGMTPLEIRKHIQARQQG